MHSLLQGVQRYYKNVLNSVPKYRVFSMERKIQIFKGNKDSGLVELTFSCFKLVIKNSGQITSSN